MNSDAAVFAQVMIVIVSSVAGFVVIGLGARVLWRMGSRTAPRAVASGDTARLERLEQAVEAVAIEVERISEAQRFTINVLTDRLPPRADKIGELPLPKRVNTPH